MGFFSDLFGSSARDDIRAASKKANQHLDAGFADATKRYDEGYDLFQPYAERGEEGAQAYRNALLGTPEQKQALFNSYSSDPGQMGALGLESNALLRKFNAAGSGTGGGRLGLAGARVAQEGWNNYLNRLSGLGDTGLQATNNQSNIRIGQGDLRWNLAGTKAGNAINTGSAVANTRTTGINNILGLGSTALKAVTAFSDARLKRDVVQVGELPSGLPIVEFKYAWEDDVRRGVIAQDAAKLFPEAVSEDPETGYLLVDYSQIS